MAKKNIHVSAKRGGGWSVSQNGKQVSAHRSQQDAIEAGRRKAARAGAELITHARDGAIRSKDSYVVAYRLIRESVGTPSVSRAKIAAAARDVIRSEGGWAVKSSDAKSTGKRPSKGTVRSKSTSRVSSKRRIS
jgi:hypothetical protein